MRSGARQRWTTRTRRTLLLAATTVLFVTACTEESPDTPPPSGIPTATAAPSGVSLPSVCTAWAEPPTGGGLEVYATWLDYTGPSPEIDLTTNWTAVVYNSSDLVAVGMMLTPTFTVNGEDVTDELEVTPDGPFGHWDGPAESRENTRLTGVLDSPPKWKHSAKFTATVTADAWCVPTPS